MQVGISNPYTDSMSDPSINAEALLLEKLELHLCFYTCRHVKGKVFVLLANSSVAVFRRFPGELK